jgi:hypothetical protein
MPLKKPKEVKLPKPFADLEQSEDDAQRMRALVMKREMLGTDGFSFTAPPESWWALQKARLGPNAGSALAALGMGALLVTGFMIAANTGIERPETIIYAESWRGDRSAKDAVDEREEAMAKLRAEVMANRAAVAAAEARARALQAERDAARAATPAG